MDALSVRHRNLGGERAGTRRVPLDPPGKSGYPSILVDWSRVGAGQGSLSHTGGRKGMDGSYPNPLRLWEGPSAAVVQDLFGPPGAGLVIPDPQVLPPVSDPQEVAGRLFACESIKARPRKGRPEFEGEPYTLQWFLSIESHRHGRHARWL